MPSSMQTESLGAELRRLIAPHLPKELVHPRAVDALTTTLNIFPSDISRVFGFECRIGTEDKETDFFMRISPVSGGRDLLLAPPANWISAEVATHEVWRRLRAFAEAWNTQGSPLERDVCHIWFEFDVTQELPKVPVPSILFIHPRLCDEPARANWVARHLEMTRQTVELITGNALNRVLMSNLEACIAALPELAQVFCIGVMVGRPGSDIRLCLKNFSPGDHMPYLARIGLPGVARLAPVLEMMQPYVDSINLDLDIGSDIGPKVHLELRCDEEFAPGVERRWQRFMEALLARGLVLSSKAKALLAWPGLPLEKITVTREKVIFLRKLSHIKLVWVETEPLETKGYFGVWECLRRKS